MKKGLRIFLYCFLGLALFLFVLGWYLYVPDIPPEVLNEKYDVKPSQYIQVDGMDVHYRVEGPATADPPLVLLHGTSSSLYTWNAWTEMLKDQYRIIRLDLPGFGLTGPHPKGDYNVEIYLEFLESFLEKLEVEECILVGNSIGGEIAWRYALNHPEQVKKLVLIGAAGYPVDIEELPLAKLPLSYLWLRIPWVRELSVEFSSHEVIRNSLEYLYGDPEKVTDEIVELYFDMTHRDGNREALTERMESFGRKAPYKKIPTIKTRTLILWGEKDRLIPVENAKHFHRDLRNSSLTIFSEAGHMPMEEIPQKSVEAVKSFLTQDSIAKKGKGIIAVGEGIGEK